MLQGKGQILAVLRGEGRDAELDAGQIDAFMLAERSAIDDFANHFLAANLLDAQFNQTVREKDAVSAVDFARQRSENSADARSIAQNPRSGDDEALSRAQHHGPASRERSGANLRALQIGQDGDGLFPLDSSSAERGNILRMLGVRAVREIQAGHIHSGMQQTANHARRATRRADGANDFGVTKSHSLSRKGVYNDPRPTGQET